MENKNKTLTIGILIFILGLIIGIVIPEKKSYPEKRGFDNRMMHQMPDGTMMSNNENMMDMKGMMQAMSDSLKGKTGDVFDKAFLEEMIVHHEGAVLMAQDVLKNSKRAELIKLANEIISAQTREIQMMKGWGQTWFSK